MKYIKYIAVLMAVILTLGCVACSNDKDDKEEQEPENWSIIGKWHTTDEGDVMYYTFHENGKLVTEFIDMGQSYIYNFSYNLEGNTLRLRDEDGVYVYTITHTQNSFTIVEEEMTFYRL